MNLWGEGGFLDEKNTRAEFSQIHRHEVRPLGGRNTKEKAEG